MNLLNQPSAKIGKNLLATLSTSLYRESFFLFREYIQNASDAIDEAIRQGILKSENAQINITLDKGQGFLFKKGNIEIRDNGTGIPEEFAYQTLINIADSKKDPTVSKGRYGIGRLGGLGYCDKLIFETSAYGERVKSILEWDAQKMHKLLVDKTIDDDAFAILARVTTFRTEPCSEDEHFFQVRLEGIGTSHKELLNEKEVGEYLSQAAPVPFDKDVFGFADDIYKFLKDNDIHLNEYKVNLNGNRIYKIYTAPIKDTPAKNKVKEIEVRAVYCGLLKDENDYVRAWYWFAITDIEGVLKNEAIKGLRLRQWNIQIGDSSTLSTTKLWQEDRGNRYFVGEVHTLDTNLVPNARRDYFEENEECRLLEDMLRNLFVEMTVIYRKSSDLRNWNRDIRNYNEKKIEFDSKEESGKFRSKTEKDTLKRELKQSEEKAKDSEKKKKRFESKITQGNDSNVPSLSDSVLASVLNVGESPQNNGKRKIAELLIVDEEQEEENGGEQPDSVFDEDILTEEQKQILNFIKDLLSKEFKQDKVQKLYVKVFDFIFKLQQQKKSE